MPQYAYTQYPTHSILHSMPHSMPTQYASVCLHTLYYTDTLTFQIQFQVLKSQNSIQKLFLNSLLATCFS